MNPAQFWALEMQNQQNQQAQAQQNMQNVMGGLQQLAGAYSDNKQLEAKASSYDDIGKILNTAMFSQNPDAAAAFGNLQKEKDPRKKVMGYEQLFSLVGPMSNMMMAQGNMGIRQNAPIINAGLKGAERIAGGEGTVPLPEEPPLPVQDDSTLPPSQPRQPSPDAVTAANAWYNQSKGNGGMFQTGAMPPFYRK